MIETVESIRREVVVPIGQARTFEEPGAWTATLDAYARVAGSREAS